MSIKNEIKQLQNLVGIKKIIILEGNVDDIYEYKGKYINIHEVVKNIFDNKDYKDYFVYDKNEGLKGNNFSNLIMFDETNSSQSNSNNFDELFSSENNSEQSSPQQGQIKIPNTFNFFQLLNKNFNRKDKRKIGFIADYSSNIFSDQTLSEDDLKSLTEFSKSLKEFEFNISTIGELESCAIFITKKINQLPPTLYLDNPDIITLTLPKPNREEREMFLKIAKPKLSSIKDIQLEFENIVDAMEGWTIKEISHFVKFSSNYNQLINFKNMLNIYLFGEKTSPWEELNYEKIQNIKEHLSKRVIGQEEAIEKVSKVIYKAFTGLSGITYSSKRTKPKGTLFFVGPTGTGKTELAKAITTFLFNDESNLIRFDMSEYGQENSDQKLIGAPPGYVGFEGGGQLTNAIKEKPFSVVLFDEIEKASPKIFDKFLQILEDGRLTDNTGKTISFSETFIIFTSNIGTNQIKPNNDKEFIYKEFIKQVHNHFKEELNRPELLGRFGNNIVPFNFISDKNLQAKIIAQKVVPLQKAILEKYKIKLKIVLNDIKMINILTKDADPSRGGRDVVNSLETNLVDPLSVFIFENLPKMKPNSTITTLIHEDKIIFKLNE